MLLDSPVMNNMGSHLSTLTRYGRTKTPLCHTHWLYLESVCVHPTTRGPSQSLGSSFQLMIWSRSIQKVIRSKLVALEL